LWLAALAQQDEDWQGVLDHALPLAAQGDFTAKQYAARAYEAFGDLGKAIDLLQETGNVEELMRLGQTAHQADELETAYAAYTAAWELDPRQATARLTLVLKDLDRPEEAQQIYLAALEQVGRYDPRIPGWQRGLARLYAQLGRWGEAVAAYEAALAAAGLDAAFDADTLYYEMANAYHQNGQIEPAIAAIETAISRQPSGDAYLLAGRIYESAGRVANALAAYKLALELMPENRAASEAVERLETGP
jgi:tetratricopeptide (TPR) repeat protein